MFGSLAGDPLVPEGWRGRGGVAVWMDLVPVNLEDAQLDWDLGSLETG